MQAKTKLLFIVTLMLLTLTIATIVNIALNFRSYSIKSATSKAHMTADVVKTGLTAHMVNGTMDKRQYYLDQISMNDEVKALWLTRSEHVVSQYGEGFANETIRDEIDKKVLETGKSVQKVIERTDSIVLRVTIPYKATTEGTPNCLTCHSVQRDDVLGGISMEFDISSMRTTGALTLIKILGINLLFLLIVLLLINKYVSPYTKLFTNLQDGISKAFKGDFTHNFSTTVGGDAKDLTDHMNTLFTKMQETFGEIKHNLATFTSHKIIATQDPLYEAKVIINELSDINKFKKTIERDMTKAAVYSRIVQVLEIKFNITHFAFYEIDDIKQTRNLIYISKDRKSTCFDFVNKQANECRTYRTESDTISTDFVDVCQTCNAKGLEYLCSFFNINSEVSLILSFTATTEEEISQINSIIPNIRHYLEAAKPVIESKVLTEKLRDTSLRDGMTGLYNRRFLEEFIDQVMSQAQRENETYSVLMLDVDFFKNVNDTYGHDVGDQVIVAIGKVLKENIRDADLAIRYGGEEFIVMLYNANEKGTLDVAKKIHSAFADLVFNVGSNETMQKTMSIGISMFPTDGDTIWKCIKFADTALYVAKTTGRNKIVKYTAEMSENEHVR